MIDSKTQKAKYVQQSNLCDTLTEQWKKGKMIYIGSFKTVEEAVCARNEYIRKNELVEYKIQEI